jgi:hypothetical protein
MTKQPTTIRFNDLPAVGTDLEGGTFVGITTRQDGSHCAVVLLPDQGSNLTWKAATSWAKKLKAELPSRPVAALLFANAKDKLRPHWHWTSEAYDASSAWGCYFRNGSQGFNLKSYEGCAVAVRCIPLTA